MSTEKVLRELMHSRVRVEKLLASNERITKELKELQEGACRYHCRTAKANYMRGWLDALKHVDSAIGWNPKEREGGWNENRASS